MTHVSQLYVIFLVHLSSNCYKMQVSIIFIICTCFCILIYSRPLDEEDSREASDAEYEGNDDNKQEEYIGEDQEAAGDEVQKMVVNQEDKQESPNEFRHSDRDSRGDQNGGYKDVSDADLNDDKESPQDNPNVNLKQDNGFFSQNDHKIYHSDTNKAVERTEDFRDHNQKLGSRNSNPGQGPEYSGDLLFKINQDNLNKERNDQMEIEDQPNLVKQPYSKMQQNKDSPDGRTYESTFNIRDRRETDDHQSDAKNSDTSIDNNESSIINNIKKLSDKDLENLLNALPEDKKAILRKIMEKREITKKAGAVDDHGLDSSKLESSFSIDSKTVSDLATEASETNKQNESEESSTKSQENESDSGKTENKSSLNANTNGQTLEFNIEAATLSSYNQDAVKNDNKREANLDEHKELLGEVKSNDDATDENSYDLSSNQDAIYSDSEDWAESKGDDSNTQKREIGKENDESIRSLEESFPNADAYYDRSLNMEPLVRVKRTELKHRVKKRDLSSLVSEVPFVPGFQDKKCENIALNEFEDKGYSNNPSSFVKCDGRIKRNSVARDEKTNFKANNTKVNEDSEMTQAPQYSIDYNTDLSSVKCKDDNVNMRNKISVAHGRDNSMKLIRSSRTIDPINNDSHFSSDNHLDTPNYKEDSFESHIEKSENNLSRSKRI